MTKYIYLHVLQSDHGYGFDDITESEDYKEVRQDLKDYRENEPHVEHRIIKRRVLRTTITEHAMCATCAQIAIQGYSDALADVKEHQDRCNYIDKLVLPVGSYWKDNDPRPLTQNDGEYCTGCRQPGATVSVQSAKDY